MEKGKPSIRRSGQKQKELHPCQGRQGLTMKQPACPWHGRCFKEETETRLSQVFVRDASARATARMTGCFVRSARLDKRGRCWRGVFSRWRRLRLG
jgi:hypothetical protein